MPAVTLPENLQRAIALPLGFETPAEGRAFSVAVLLHLYYEDLGPELRDLLTASMVAPADLYVTTDTSEKQGALERCFADWPHGSVEVRRVVNRGRDVAPRIVGLWDVHDRYDLLLHLHGKKSLYWERGGEWRGDQLHALAGNRQIVRGVLEAFHRWPRLGIVMPRVFPPVRPSINWGYDLERCTALGDRLGLAIDRSSLLHFPAGSMFWSRRGALRPLLDLRLRVDDFEPEDGLLHGSTAHAIERLVLNVCERAGFHWIAVGPRAETSDGSLIEVDSPGALDRAVAASFVLLTDPANIVVGSSLARGALRARFQPDRNAPKRLTLIIGDDDCGPIRLYRLLKVFRSQSDFVKTRVVVESRAALRRLKTRLPPEVELVPLYGLPLPAPLGLGVNDVLIAGSRRGADLAESLRAACEATGQPAFRYWHLHDAAARPRAPRRRLWSWAGRWTRR